MRITNETLWLNWLAKIIHVYTSIQLTKGVKLQISCLLLDIHVLYMALEKKTCQEK